MFLIGIENVPALIANGSALSAGIPLGAKSLVGISMPAAWTAAALTFQVSPDGGTTYQELVDATGAAISFTVAAGTFIQLSSAAWLGINMLKVRSGTSGAPVNQAADRTIGLIIRYAMN